MIKQLRKINLLAYNFNEEYSLLCDISACPSWKIIADVSIIY